MRTSHLDTSCRMPCSHPSMSLQRLVPLLNAPLQPAVQTGPRLHLHVAAGAAAASAEQEPEDGHVDSELACSHADNDEASIKMQCAAQSSPIDAEPVTSKSAIAPATLTCSDQTPPVSPSAATAADARRMSDERPSSPPPLPSFVRLPPWLRPAPHCGSAQCPRASASEPCSAVESHSCEVHASATAADRVGSALQVLPPRDSLQHPPPPESQPSPQLLPLSQPPAEGAVGQPTSLLAAAASAARQHTQQQRAAYAAQVASSAPLKRDYTWRLHAEQTCPQPPVLPPVATTARGARTSGHAQATTAREGTAQRTGARRRRPRRERRRRRGRGLGADRSRSRPTPAQVDQMAQQAMQRAAELLSQRQTAEPGAQCAVAAAGAAPEEVQTDAVQAEQNADEHKQAGELEGWEQSADELAIGVAGTGAATHQAGNAASEHSDEGSERAEAVHAAAASAECTATVTALPAMQPAQPAPAQATSAGSELATQQAASTCAHAAVELAAAAAPTDTAMFAIAAQDERRPAHPPAPRDAACQVCLM